MTYKRPVISTGRLFSGSPSTNVSSPPARKAEGESRAIYLHSGQQPELASLVAADAAAANTATSATVNPISFVFIVASFSPSVTADPLRDPGYGFRRT